MENPYALAGAVLAAQSADGFHSLALYGDAVAAPLAEKDGCTRFHLENESGTGDITLFRAFPGVELVYNDIHMSYCNKDQSPAPGVIEINYCREGRCECLFGAHRYCYMAAGDLSFCSLHERAHQSGFPTAHYHGITVTLDAAAITAEMRQVLALLDVDLGRIRALARAADFTLIRANPTIEHIFSELYTVPEPIRPGYIRIKMLELLLVLTGLDAPENRADARAYSENQIDTIKQVQAFLVSHYREHHTIDVLAAQFDISPTVLKSCFKGVYGDSVYAYMKRYRLQVAERLLRESRLTVGEIAAQIGFLNPNKFTSAFRAAYGMPPTDYRRARNEIE